MTSSLGEQLTSYHLHILISASLFIFLCVCVCVWKPLEVSQLERRGGGENRKQRSASLLFYHPLVGKYVIKSAASSEAPGL